MENGFLLAQIIGLCAMGINIFAWQLKNSRHIIFSYVPAGSLWALQYIILGAPLGVVMNVCSVIKDFFLTFINADYVIYIIGLFMISIWSIGLYFYDNWYDILPLFGATVTNLSLLQRDNRSFVARGVICAQIFWISYNLIVGSYAAALSGIMVICSSTIGMARHEKWIIGNCYRTFAPSLVRALFSFPSFRTFP
ncbi:MAG: hypothetical protein CMH31_05680 [Micavibrio sp.]|nr:hypothetical protein [Micavibrio sp.]|tara:strand:+ start:235 stop:819 length:585 start_codon:yes stop_codon:yes gene_type:complete